MTKRSHRPIFELYFLPLLYKCIFGLLLCQEEVLPIALGSEEPAHLLKEVYFLLSHRQRYHGPDIEGNIEGGEKGEVDSFSRSP